MLDTYHSVAVDTIAGLDITVPRSRPLWLARHG
jgi:hypothetical protein